MLVTCSNPGCGQINRIDLRATGPHLCERCQAVLPSSHSLARESLPSHVGRFQVRSFLGAGAFGSVYRARDPLLDRDVALKVARPGSLGDRTGSSVFCAKLGPPRPCGTRISSRSTTPAVWTDS